MNIETLRYFKYVARYKNISKVANQFYISQSTLSRQIKALEDEWGVELFSRDKNLMLTEAGELLAARVDGFIKHYELIEKDVKTMHDGGISALHIVAQDNLCPEMYEIIERYKSENPHIKLIVEATEFDKIPSSLYYDIHDIGFTYDLTIPIAEDVSAMPLRIDTYSLIVPKSLYPNPTRDDLKKIITELPFIQPPYNEPPFFRILKHKLMDIAGVKQLKAMEVKNMESMIFDVSLGIGYGIVPTLMYDGKVNNDEIGFIDLNMPEAKAMIVMIYKNRENANNLVKFTDIAKEYSDKISDEDMEFWHHLRELQ